MNNILCSQCERSRFYMIYVILRNRANFEENPSMRAITESLRVRAGEHLSKFCEQIEQRQNFASSWKFLWPFDTPSQVVAPEVVLGGARCRAQALVWTGFRRRPRASTALQARFSPLFPLQARFLALYPFQARFPAVFSAFNPAKREHDGEFRFSIWPNTLSLRIHWAARLSLNNKRIYPWIPQGTFS